MRGNKAQPRRCACRCARHALHNGYEMTSASAQCAADDRCAKAAYAQHERCHATITLIIAAHHFDATLIFADFALRLDAIVACYDLITPLFTC